MAVDKVCMQRYNDMYYDTTCGNLLTLAKGLRRNLLSTRVEMRSIMKSLHNILVYQYTIVNVLS